jgi:ketosteroid isomerase-like protein
MPRLPRAALFASPEECEQAFYEALGSADSDAVADLWLQDDEVACIHPGSPRLLGYAAVRASWAAILGNGPIHVRVVGRHCHESPTLAVTTLVEEMIVATPGGGRQVVHVLATNAFLKTPAGWKMVLHQGAGTPQGQMPDVQAPPATVH